MTDPARLGNQPPEFHTFVGPPHHRLFAIFDDEAAAEEALAALRFEGVVDGKEAWVFCGEEGAERLGAVDRRHGIRARGFGLLQRVMSSDRNYLRGLGAALREGHVVLGAWVPDEKRADEVARMFRLHGGHSMAYCTHWDFVPVTAA
ncbi:MAG TPA: hypothetical protein VEI83_13225 [Acidimicrobiales bacterium]|nr:hypothetical protein [Acidimicrobiales bacterium]